MSDNITGPDPREDDPTLYSMEITFTVEFKRTVTTSNRDAQADIEAQTEDVRLRLLTIDPWAEITHTDTERR